MNQIITFGEVLMRILPLGNSNFIQSNSVGFYFGVTELNVGISIANSEGDVKHISCISKIIRQWSLGDVNEADVLSILEGNTTGRLNR